MFAKRIFVCVLLLSLVLTLASCRKQEEPQPTTTKPRNEVVNNIYITDEGIFTDASNSQNASQMVSIETLPPATQIVTDAAVPATEVTTETTTQAVLTLEQYSAEMILAAITDAVNNAKMQQNFSAHLLQQVTINLTDCTFSWAVPIINAAIGVFNGPHDFDYTFVNGVCSDPKEDFKTTVTPMDAIPPSARLFALEESGLVAWSAYEENGEYVYTVVLPYEFTNAEVSVPYYHAQALDYLDLGDFDFGIGEITDANCNYPGATVTVRTKPDGTLLKYEETIPMSGSGTGKLGISLSASFEGDMYECWTFNW